MILRFGLVSGTGWLIDFCLFLASAWAGAPVWLANMLGASVAVLFVFFVSVHRVFKYKGGYLVGKLVLYVIYQIIAISLASLLIDGIVRWYGASPLIAKVFVTPLTFYVNFQFMSLLTTGKLRLL